MSRFEELHPEFRPLAQSILTHVAHLCALSGCKWSIASGFRDPEKQWELYKKGRKQVGVDWVRIQGQSVVTNARPDQTPHCITLQGKPASCAVDIALLQDGKYLPDKDPRWGIIGAAIGLSGATSSVSWGGMFSSIRDFPHIELKDWKKHVGKGAQ